MEEMGRSVRYLSASFSFAVASFYFACVPMLAYSVKYLSAKGFTKTEIGCNLAVSAVLCITVQLYIGRFLDRKPEFSAKQVVIVNTLLELAIAVVMLLSDNRYVLYVAVILMVMSLDSLLSVFATWAMEYINAGYSLNYSLSKGIGGLAYSVGCLVTGYVIEDYGVDRMIPLMIVALLIMFISVLLLRSVRKSESVLSGFRQDKVGTTEGKDYLSFFRSDHSFFLLMISFLLCYISYTSINNFQVEVVEQAGGNSRALGISTAYASFLEFPAMLLFPFLAKKFGYRRILEFSCFFFFVKVFLIIFADSMRWVLASQTMQFFSYGLFIPCSAHFVNQILPKEQKSKGQAALGIFTYGLSGLIASLLSGCMLDYFSVHSLALVESVVCFIGVLGVLYSCKRLAREGRGRKGMSIT